MSVSPDEAKSPSVGGRELRLAAASEAIETMPLTPLVEDDKDKLDHLRMRSSWSTWDALKTLPDVQLARFRAIQVPGYTDRCWTR